MSHPAFKNTSGTLLNALLAYAGSAWTPALVSRLDKGTSGILLVAKSGAVQAALQRVSQQNGIEKDYLAIVHGKPPAKGTIDLALDRDPWDRRRVTVRDRGGVPSVTKFERLRTVSSGARDLLSLAQMPSGDRPHPPDTRALVVKGLADRRRCHLRANAIASRNSRADRKAGAACLAPRAPASLDWCMD